jgi:hypothetical protein
LALLIISMHAPPIVLGSPLATKLRRVLQPLPAALAELAERLLEPRRRTHLAGAPRRRIGVTRAIERRHHLLAIARAFLEHGLRRVEPRFFEAR